MTSLTVEPPVDDVHLLLARQTHEVDSVSFAGYSDLIRHDNLRDRELIRVGVGLQ